jgi:hypothetical protein
MRKISCVIVLLMVLIGGCFAQSQPKTEQKANETPNTQSTATPQNSKIAAPPVSAISPSTNHAADSTAKKSDKVSSGEPEGTESWVWLGYRVKITDGLLAAFTGMLVVVGIFQACYLGKATQHFKIVERAFISASFTQNANRDIGTGNVTHWIFKPVWTNGGSTPTRHMNNHISIHILANDLPEDWDFPNVWAAAVPVDKRKPVPLGVSPKGSIEGQSVSVTVDDMDDIVGGQKKLFLWGMAEYNDVFPHTPKRITRFAVRVVAGGNPRDPNRMSFSYIFLPTHNCSDEECTRQGYPAAQIPRILEG